MTYPHEESNEPETIFSNVTPYTGETPEDPQAVAPPLPMVQVKTAYTTAVTVQKPRQLNDVVATVMNEAQYAKESFYYSFPMGGKKVEGPSIGLAMAVARAWGNCAIPTSYYESGGEWVFTANFIDLETGFTVSRVFTKKVGKGLFKKLDDERAIDMTFQAAQSRAIRNVITMGVPRWLLQQAIDKAKEAVLKGITHEGVAHATESALKYLAGYGVSAEQVEAVMGKKATEWDAEDLATLRGMASQLKDGQATAAQLFPPVVAPPPQGKKPPEPAKEKPVITKPEEKMDKQQSKQEEPPKEPPPGMVAGDPTGEPHNPNETAGAVVEDSVEALFEANRNALWQMVVTKGVDLNEMERFTGVARKEHITQANFNNIQPFVLQWSPAGKGGRKK